MPARDPMSFPKWDVSFDTMRVALTESQHPPHIGITQGGSSRKFSGCRPAATKGEWRPPKRKK